MPRIATISAGSQSGLLAALTTWRATAGGLGSRLGSRATASNCSRVALTPLRGGVEAWANIVADTAPSLLETPAGGVAEARIVGSLCHKDGYVKSATGCAEVVRRVIW